MTRVLIIRNVYDTLTFYMSEWSTPLITEAVRRGLRLDTVDGKNVTKDALASRIIKTCPRLLILNGHGDGSTFYGHNGEPAIGLHDAHILSNTITFVRACNCSETLGPAAVEKHGCTSFVGYRYEFFNVRQNSKELTPLHDDVSRPIWEASNAVPLALIKGSTVEEAVAASHRRTDKEIAPLVQSADPAALEVLKALIINDEGLGFHGSGTAAI